MPIFFDQWESIVRTLIVGALGFAGVVALLLISGKRTLSKMNSFDFIVTIALGSTLATMLLSKDTALAQGLTAIALLVLLQYAVTWTSVRWSAFSNFVKAEPSLLFHNGRYLDAAMRRERVNRAELHAAMRGAGLASSRLVAAMVLETDGTITVIGKDGEGAGEILPREK